MVKFLAPTMVKDRFDVVMVLDGDVVATHRAPPFHQMDLRGRIGIVHDDQHQAAYDPSYDSTSYYKEAECEGFRVTTSLKSICNTGMFICRPALHAEYLKNLVDRFAPYQIGHPRKFHFEQSVMSYTLQVDDQVTILPWAWNRILSSFIDEASPSYDHYRTIADRGAFFIHHSGKLLFGFARTYSQSVPKQRRFSRR